MAPPSQLSIATNAVVRLLKEELSYRRELRQQLEKIEKLEKDMAEGKDDEEGNASYILAQQRKAKEETEAVFGPVRTRIEEAVQTLEGHIEGTDKSAGESSSAEVLTAKETVAKAKETLTDMKAN